jgi:acetyl-CoA carboxylase carboxyl transferase subunit beta
MGHFVAIFPSIIMTWFQKEKVPIQPPKPEERTVRTEGLFRKCDGCNAVLWKRDLDVSLNVCVKCGFHFRMSARQRLEMLFDNGQYEEYGGNLRSPDPLNFVDKKAYRDRLSEARRLTGLNDAAVNGCGFLSGYRVLISGMESAFISGSMGCVVGEMITLAVERATSDCLPLIVISASGGARMHEGVLSLMQMAKISAALARLDRKGLPFVSVLTDPTTGGVTASYAMLGDLNIAEPNALIGFAGPRVIEQTIRQKLPKGFQRSEFLLERGMLDAVVDRRHLKEYLTRALHFFLK